MPGLPRTCGTFARLGGAALLLLVAGSAVTPAAALETVTFRREGAEIRVEGRVLVEAEDGGLLIEARDGAYWAVQPDELGPRTSDERPFAPLGREELREQLLSELPAGFEAHETANYLVLHNTSPAYAQWCGALLERLLKDFQTYWGNLGRELRPPAAPLVVLAFRDRDSYIEHTSGELGAAAKSIVAYYSLASNRVCVFDLTGLEELRIGEADVSTADHINTLLAQPNAERAVATLIHEAVHQAAFNCGLQVRYADNPLWLSEGLAVYFETPDLRNPKGWRGIGRVNRFRLERVRELLPKYPPGTIAGLVKQDELFRGPRTAEDAYALAWAWNYFLLKQEPRAYVRYLEGLAAKGPLLYDTPEERLAEFRGAFGEDVAALETRFLRFLRSVR